MAIQPFAKSITTFSQFEKAVRSSGHQLTDTEVTKAAKQFAVPLADVQQLRTEMLAEANAVGDDVGEKSKNLRQQSSFGVPAGMGAQLRVGVPAVAGDAEAVPTQIPRYIDVATTGLLWAGMDTAVLQDQKKNQISLSFAAVGTPKDGELQQYEAKVGFAKAGSGEPTKHVVGADLARQLTTLLDKAHAEHPDANSVSARSLQNQKILMGRVLTAAGASQADEIKLINKGVALINGGKGEQAAKLLGRLAESVADPGLRAETRFLLGEVLHRLGRDDEALDALKLAGPSLGPDQRTAALLLRAQIHNARREFGLGANVAKLALASLDPQKADLNQLGGAHFALGVAQKNLGDIDDAVNSMKAALAVRPGSVATQIALAGYLAIAGKRDEGQKILDGIPEPTERLPRIDFHMNTMWFHGVARDLDKTLEAAEKALQAGKDAKYVGVKAYIGTETDFDWLRKDPAFKALLARF